MIWLSEQNHDNLLGVYIRLINSRKEFNGLSFADSDPIDGMFNSDDQIIQFRRKWGDGFSYEEYLNLEDRYDKLIQEKGEPDFAKSDAYRKFILASVVYDREISSTTATDRNSATNNYFKALQAAGRYRDWETDRKSTRLNSSHSAKSRMPSSA